MFKQKYAVAVLVFISLFSLSITVFGAEIKAEDVAIDNSPVPEVAATPFIPEIPGPAISVAVPIISAMVPLETLTYAADPQRAVKISPEDRGAFLEELNKIIDREPVMMLEMTYVIARSLERENKTDEAVSLYERALKISPDNNAFLYRLLYISSQKAK